MAVDRVLYREFGLRFDRADKFFDSSWSQERIENQNTFVANDKAGIARRQTSRFSDRRIDSIRDFNKLKIVFGFGRAVNSFRTEGSGRDHQSDHDQSKRQSLLH